MTTVLSIEPHERSEDQRHGVELLCAANVRVGSKRIVTVGFGESRSINVRVIAE